MVGIFRKIGMSFWPSHFLCRFQWYRKWYGGRWERHWIEMCASFIWLPMRQDKKWPDYIQPGSHGIPFIEDYPYKQGV